MELGRFDRFALLLLLETEANEGFFEADTVFSCSNFLICQFTKIKNTGNPSRDIDFQTL